MENKSFSKIWILVIFVILIGGGIFVLYLGMPSKVPKAEKPPEKKLEKKSEVSTEVIEKFMNLRLKADPKLYPKLYSYFPGYILIRGGVILGKGLISYSRILLLSPHIKKYEIVEGKEIGPSKFQFAIKTYLGKEKDFGYYDERIIFEKIGGKPLVTSFKQSEYTSLIKEDPCKNVSQEKTTIAIITCTKKEACYFKLAREEKNPDICDKIENSDAKNFCYEKIALVQDNLGLCNRMETGIRPGREDCRTQVKFWRKREELSGQYSPYQPEPIEEWKTYRNEQYGFELKYPKGSKIKEEISKTRKGKKILQMDLPFTPKTKLRKKYLKIIITENGPTSLINGPIETEEIPIKKINFTKIVSGDCEPLVCETYVNYYTVKDNKYFNLDFTLRYITVNSPEFKSAWELMDFDKNQESVIFDKVVSTFRFTR